MMNAIEFDQVSVVFGDAPMRALPLMDQGLSRADVQAGCGQTLGVHDATLTVAEGEILVLMGLSGSGKSTLLRAINGLNPIARGGLRVRHGDRMVDLAQAGDAGIRALRREAVSMVFQQFGLLPWRSVAENVGLGLELAGVPARERAARITAQLDLVGLGGHADARVDALSGGMQQRVGLARAFATEAPILLMDEPFSALDPLIRGRLQQDLLAMQAQMRRTIVFVSHDLEEALRIGDRIVLMEGGRIVQIGTPHQIITAPATPYVADFVAAVNPLSVLCARDVMVAGEAASSLPGVAADLPLTEVMSRLLDAQGDLAVIEGGRAIGTVGHRQVLARLAR